MGQEVEVVVVSTLLEILVEGIRIEGREHKVPQVSTLLEILGGVSAKRAHNARRPSGFNPS